MKSKKKLLEKFDSDFTDIMVVNGYEQNKEEIELILKRGNDLDKSAFFRIKIGKYLTALMAQKNYRKSLVVIDELEYYLRSVNGQLTSLKQFGQILTLQKGKCLLRIGEISESKKLFEILVEKYPNNENYFNWLKASKRGLVERVTSKLTFVGLALFGLIWIVELVGFMEFPFILGSTIGIITLSSILAEYLLKYVINSATSG